MTATLDWSQCPAVDSIPGRVSGAWVFKDTRMPVATVFENLEAGLTVEGAAQFAGSIVNLENQKVLPIGDHSGADAIQKYHKVESVSTVVHQVGTYDKCAPQQTRRSWRFTILGRG